MIRQEFTQIMATLADLTAAQATTAQAITDLAARVGSGSGGAVDLQPAVDAETAMQAQLAAIDPSALPTA
jgi:hypothetical protein